ncbi:MAG: glycosyltransferase [Pirellulales bacterium]|nr:glycosyltransferase [Pirellulales bacterium]
MNKLKVALCITELDWGGAERCLVRLATGLDREHFEPTIYCLAPPPKGEINCLAPLEEAGIPVHCLGGKNKWHFPLVLHRLTALLKKNRPDVVQSFLFHANLMAAVAAHRAGVRPVISGIRVAEHRSNAPFWASRFTDRWIDRYVCVSRSVADFYRTKTRISSDKLLVIPNGIDLGDYPLPNPRPADLSSQGISNERRLVCFVGRLEPQKGVQWLVETAGEWLEKMPDCDLLIVGDGPQRGLLEEIVVSQNISDRVHFAGRRADVPQILARCELLVLPSAWEGMPNVVMEAMASGLPVVACEVEGVSELLGPDAAPQVIAHGDTAALSEKILALLADPELAQTLGLENRCRIGQNFALSSMICSYQQLWESLAVDPKKS